MTFIWPRISEVIGYKQMPSSIWVSAKQSTGRRQLRFWLAVLTSYCISDQWEGFLQSFRCAPNVTSQRGTHKVCHARDVFKIVLNWSLFSSTSSTSEARGKIAVRKRLESFLLTIHSSIIRSEDWVRIFYEIWHWKPPQLSLLSKQSSINFNILTVMKVIRNLLWHN